MMVRALSAAEQQKLRAMHAELDGPIRDGEPENEADRLMLRLQRVRELHAEACELIGFDVEAFEKRNAQAARVSRRGFVSSDTPGKDSGDMTPDDPPRATGAPPRTVDLVGMLAPVDRGEPVYVQIHKGSLAVPVFSSLETLKQARAWLELGDGFITLDEEFVQLLAETKPLDVQVIVDVRKTPEGLVRYARVRLPWQS